MECLRKSCKLQLDVSRVVCPGPCTYQALLAFAVKFWCPEVGLLNLLSQALNKRTGVLCSLLCCRVGSLSGLECQGLGTVGLLMLRPSRAGLQEERCLAVSCSTAVPPRKKAWQDFITSTSREASTFSLTHTLVQTRTCVEIQVHTSGNMLVRIYMNSQLSRHTHASTDANRPMLLQACSLS